MQVADSLMMFIQSAQMFLQNELRIPFRNEVVKYMIVHHFEKFSAAYSRYRHSPDESARHAIAEVLKYSEQQYEASAERARSTHQNIPV